MRPSTWLFVQCIAISVEFLSEFYNLADIRLSRLHQHLASMRLALCGTPSPSDPLGRLLGVSISFAFTTRVGFVLLLVAFASFSQSTVQWLHFHLRPYHDYLLFGRYLRFMLYSYRMLADLISSLHVRFIAGLYVGNSQRGEA